MTLQVRIWLSLLLVSLAGYASYSGWRIYRAVGAATPSRHIDRTRATGSLADVQLVDTAGAPFSLESLQGKVWLASFFFSSCPGPCAQMNRSIAGLQNEIKDDDLRFVSITVDPATDTPEVLSKYARMFGADPKRWAFLSGPFNQVQHLGAAVFQVAVGRQVHTERVILLDKWSNMRGLYLTSDPSQTIALKRKIRELLAEATPPANLESQESQLPAAALVASPQDSAPVSPSKAASNDPATNENPPGAETADEGGSSMPPR
jgi:protein SCO1/2